MSPDIATAVIGVAFLSLPVLIVVLLVAAVKDWREGHRQRPLKDAPDSEALLSPMRKVWNSLEAHRKAAVVAAAAVAVASAWPLLSLVVNGEESYRVGDHVYQHGLYQPGDVWRWYLMLGGLAVASILAVVGAFSASSQPWNRKSESKEGSAARRVSVVHVTPRGGQEITFTSVEVDARDQYLRIARGDQDLARFDLAAVEHWRVEE